MLTHSVLSLNGAYSAEDQKQSNSNPYFTGLLEQSREDPLLTGLFKDKCAVCHGENLQGAGIGPALVGNALKYGDTIENITQSIKNGYPNAGMPAWYSILSVNEIRNMSLYISEWRQMTEANLLSLDKNPAELPKGIIKTEQHDFRIEKVIGGLQNRLYSIAPLPDGRILLSEKKRGLSIISKDGVQSNLIHGLPPIYDDVVGDEGIGWMFDIAIHPDYKKNGWVYIQYGDRCSDCNKLSRESGQPVSMNKVIRGRIKNGAWVDEQVLWSADIETYSSTSDKTAGGRISFDHQTHVFFSIGMKGPGFYPGVQNLSLPYGKIFRLYDDGRIPKDNPFYNYPDALKGIWTYGHRSPQGLEFNPVTEELWGTEQGPRGGDEINLLLPGGNFGWPLYSKGVHYDGTPVDQGKVLGISWTLDEIEQPVVDLTPSPAISSFIFYQGKDFPEWKNSIITGTLKTQELYRFVINNNKAVHKEVLFKGYGRVRDIEVGFDGALYVALENGPQGQIVRLVKSVK